LDVKAKTITDEMCIAAAYELAKYAEDKGINDDYISPTMDETEAFIREAVAVGMKAIEQGVARVKASREELARQAEKMIREARETTALLMKEGYIPPAPEE
jgi:malate dehydrogenase (oxaloacetate-decarboxylating)